MLYMQNNNTDGTKVEKLEVRTAASLLPDAHKKTCIKK